MPQQVWNWLLHFRQAAITLSNRIHKALLGGGHWEAPFFQGEAL